MGFAAYNCYTMQSYGISGEKMIFGKQLWGKRDMEGIYQGDKRFEKGVEKIGRVKWVRDW